MRIFSRSRSTPRIHLFFIAILLKIIASLLSGAGFVLNNGIFYVCATVVWVGFFVVMLAVASPPVDGFLKERWRWLKPVALTIAVVFSVVGLLVLAVSSTVGLESIDADRPEGELSRLMTSLDNVYGYNDATALSHQAAENLLDGENPYAESNVVSAMIEFNGMRDKLTPLRLGRFAAVFPYPAPEQLEQLWEEASLDPSRVPPELESKFNYPAGSFLLPAPFVWMGIGDLRFVFLIFIVPALVYVVLKVPGRYRLLFIMALIASVELWNSLAGGETGFLYFPFLLLGWVLYRRNLWVSAVFMAIAVSTKQITWFLLPFYLIVVFRTMGWRNLLGSAAIVLGVFAAANAWFFFADPDLWLSSIFAPVAGKMFPLGVGLITIVTGGLVVVESPLIFSIMEFGVFGLALIWYWFNCRRYPDTAPLLSVLPLFFAWRSLWGYFFYIDIIVLAAVLINEYGAKANDNLKTVPLPASARG